MRVGVVGAGGKMGLEVCRAVLAQADLELVAAIDPRLAGQPLGDVLDVETALVVVADLDEARRTGADVLVDFTRRDVALSTLEFCALSGCHAVVGTTGFDDADRIRVGEWFVAGRGAANCILAANFAIGAVLLMRFAELAAPWFDGAEIIELHHEAKLDAPSGTAMHTAERMAAARAEAGDYLADRTENRVLEGARGGEGPAGIRLHSVRLPGLVAHEEVLFGSPGQALTLRHDSFHRSSFMDGVLLAVRSVAVRPGLTLGIESLLGI